VDKGGEILGGQVNIFRKLHRLILCDYRSQDRLIQSDEFTEVWNISSDGERDKFTHYIDKADPDKLRLLMENILIGSGLDKRPFDYLRKMASMRGIKYYSKMGKAELILALQE
jgi:hypothetical protein